MFFGVSTLLFTDGETSILVDGFFHADPHPGKIDLNKVDAQQLP